MMLRTKPRLNYSGLTVVLSNPSRHDTVNLLTGNGGLLFNKFCLQPEMNSMQIDVRLMEDKTELLLGTKCVIVMGEAACHALLPETRGNTLGEVRGGIYEWRGIPCIPTFSAQEAADIKNYEDEINTLSKNYSGDDSVPDSDEEEGDGKRHGKTKRANYAFWIRADTRKCKSILASLVCSSMDNVSTLQGKVALSVATVSERFTKNRMGVLSKTQPTYKIQPSADEVINILTNTKDQFLYFDIETDYEEQNLLCFSFSFDGITIYSVPVLDYTYSWAYPALHHILRALAVALRHNTVVAHNGAAFDFFVLAYKYRLSINKCYDTMLAMHRCFPDIERSLGHCTSLWTNERFHKDTDSRAYATKEHMMQKLHYCGKDVYTMFLIKQAIDNYARTIPGLTSSIDAAMDCIKPYLITTLQGIRYSDVVRQQVLADNDIILNKYLVLINYLIGDEALERIQKGKSGKRSSAVMPLSNKQCVKYFHDELTYPVVGRSPVTSEPSLAKKNLYKLQLKENNPVLSLVSVFRAIAKESSMLKFCPWKNDNNKVVDYKLYESTN